MNSKKIFSLLLLFSISFSIVHDYTFTFLENENHSTKDYMSEFKIPSSDADILCDIHFKYHTSYTFVSPSLPLQNIMKNEITFLHSETFTSRNYFNFFKPPIA